MTCWINFFPLRDLKLPDNVFFTSLPFIISSPSIVIGFIVDAGKLSPVKELSRYKYKFAIKKLKSLQSFDLKYLKINLILVQYIYILKKKNTSNINTNNLNSRT